MRAFLNYTKAIFLTLIIHFGYAIAQPADFPAFPGAEGYGALAKGGRGGRVIEVTNLNDSGPGSLRAAVTATGPRIVVFRVGGTIELKSDLEIRGEEQAYLTIAGQTAPGGGILLKSYAFWILDTHDIVVRYIRIRPGFMGIPDPRGNGGRHGILIYGYKSNAHDIIFDHVSVSWQTDDNSIWGNVYNVTIQWSIFAEGAKPRDEHDCGGCGLMWGPVDKVNQLTVHHNLLMNNFYRSPKAGGGRNQLYNNVIYNPGWSATHMVGGATGGFSNINSYPAYLDIIGNYYKKGPSTRTGVKEIRFELPYEDSHVRDIHLFLKDNFGWNYNVNDPFAIVANRNYNKHYEPLTEQAVIPVTIQSASFAKDLVIRNAGANLPERDAVDSRLIYEFNTNTGNTDVGSDWPFIANGTAPKDSDHDGMPDTWELANGFNPNSPADGNQDADGDGYTNVEEYLNEIATTDGIIAQINVDHDSGFAPLTVQFTGSGSGGTPPYNYLWEFGASSTANTQSLQHTFQNAGSYTVKLTVTDNENRSGFSYRLITVKEATSTAKTNLELKVTEVDQSAEVFSVIPEKWYDLYIQFKGSQGLEHVKYADVWVSHETYQEGNIDNRGGIHSPENNYVMSYSIANSTIWARQKEGDLVWENVTGKLGRYIDDDNHEYQQDSHNKWARARFKLLDKVRDGNWVLNAYFVDEFGQKSELFKKKIQVVSANAKPTAAIHLSAPSPINIGTVQVVLSTSLVVTQIPSPLIFNESDGTVTSINLNGSIPGKTFSGTFKVDHTVADGPGSFSLPTDALVAENGNKNNQITAGAQIVIDKTQSTPINSPTATITLSDPSPTKAGTIQLTLTTSSNVTSVPTPLTFTESDNTTTTIPLQGSVPGKVFSGVFIVDQTVADGVGKFSLPANALVGVNGEMGHTITDGVLVVIDKTPPAAPKNVRVIIAEQ